MAGPASAGCVALPDQLVHDHVATARRTAGREEVAQRALEAAVATGRRRDHLEGGVEVADVRRPQNHFCQEAREGRGLEAAGAPLAVQRCPGDPAAAPEQVDDDVAGGRQGLDSRTDELRRRGRRQPIERRQRKSWSASEEQIGARHQTGHSARGAAASNPMNARIV